MLSGSSGPIRTFAATARITISRSFRPVANWRCCTTIKIAVGDVALVDAARPVTYSADKGDQWNTVSLSLPRQSLVSYLGFEPQGGLYRSSGTPAGRLLFDLIWTSDNAERSTLS
ncbi:MAG: hypothetical protein WCB62_20080, partial [Pseudolabrys sp.]